MTAPQTPAHIPVLFEEAVAALAVQPDGVYLDGTFGRGGHAAAVLARLGAQGRLLVLDRDPEAVAVARAWAAEDPRLRVHQGSFADLGHWLTELGLDGRLQGVLLDLGVSSPQLDEPGRGFSFRQDGPLDMRMDPGSGESAADWLARVGESELAKVLRDYGEERYARRIARALIARRARAPFVRTADLAACIAAAVPRREPGKDPATRSFQAMRIHINAELDALRSGLQAALAALAPGGRLAVISFHSLEDRIVKQFLRQASQGPALPPGLPLVGEPPRGPLRLLGRAIRPSAGECAANPRSRSAVLRVAERRPETP